MSRPTVLFPLFADVNSIAGVGPKLAKTLERLGVKKIRDLVWLLPLNLVNRQESPPLEKIQDGQIVTLILMIDEQLPPKRRGQPYRLKGNISDVPHGGVLDVVLFNLPPDVVEKMFPLGTECVVSGRAEHFHGRVQMVNPDYAVPLSQRDKIPAVEAVYPLTAGLTNKRLRSLVQEALHRTPTLAEWIDPAFLKREKFLSWHETLKKVHHPETEAEIDTQHPLRRRLAYDELLANQLALASLRFQHREKPGRVHPGSGQLQQLLYNALSFMLTSSQKNALAEIQQDLAAPIQMLRLLQGDVGSGKTIVALLSLLTVIEGGHQGALMVPTEILARQHHQTFMALCQNLPLSIVLLTGREKGKVREKLLEQIQSGAAQLIIGTHALFQETVVFHDLGLAVVDEQHRFGVHQRLALAHKGTAVDMLVMTATPIPRTLLLTAYGDMAVTKITEKPPNRLPVKVSSISLKRIDEVIVALGRALTKGQRVYWVCPLVEESEKIDLAAATSRFIELQQHFGDTVVLAHGQQKAAEKDHSMQAFSSGVAQILVATTVIEVGVDVPEATVIVIEHAERFGLAQLHQLRGRVGRGNQASSCLLLFAEPLSETAKARIQIMRETDDGFLIAEEDLRLRGAGDLLGTKQSGVPEFHHADLAYHQDLLECARHDAQLVLMRDPDLQSERGHALRVLLHLHERYNAVSFIRAG